MVKTLLCVAASLPVVVLASLASIAGIIGAFNVQIEPAQIARATGNIVVGLAGLTLFVALLRSWSSPWNSAAKLAIVSLIAIPGSYFVACLDRGMISGQEFALGLVVTLASGACFGLLYFISRLRRTANNRLQNDAPTARA